MQGKALVLALACASAEGEMLIGVDARAAKTNIVNFRLMEMGKFTLKEIFNKIRWSCV
jgi:hypothetical protein